ncbi:MAG: protein TolR [Micavibrio sp.]|mgnify:CR=1 FL=1|nr:protein TolR [Micavibrio sp.]|tara:strand:+ start:287463 stop:287918 length:456 start_codon:yes stop_codon:yes gene_type:complete
MGANLQKRGGSSRRGRRRAGGFTQMSDINVTPFVDVMLVLLIVFMVTAPLLTAGVQVDLPDNNAAPVNTTDDKPIEISIDKSGSVFVGETEVELERLSVLLNEMAKENTTEQRIFVRGDKGVSYGEIMDVVGVISETGFTKIALVSNPANK